MARRTSYASLLDALRGATWPGRVPARGTYAGTHRSRLRGMSPEFTEYRPYRQGDEPRRIDWKLFARTDRAYLRITTDRATLATVFVLDASASMAFPPDSLGKWALACAVTMGLAAVAHASGDPVGLVVCAGDELLELTPRTHRGMITEAVRLLERVTPHGGATLSAAFARARAARRVVLVTDFLGDAEGPLREARAHGASGGEVYALHVVAREELDPPSTPITARDPERPETMRPLVESTREEYGRAFAAFRAELARSWRAAGVHYHLVLSDESAVGAVRRIASPAATRRGVS